MIGTEVLIFDSWPYGKKDQSLQGYGVAAGDEGDV